MHLLVFKCTEMHLSCFFQAHCTTEENDFMVAISPHSIPYVDVSGQGKSLNRQYTVRTDVMSVGQKGI